MLEMNSFFNENEINVVIFILVITTKQIPVPLNLCFLQNYLIFINKVVLLPQYSIDENVDFCVIYGCKL